MLSQNTLYGIFPATLTAVPGPAVAKSPRDTQQSRILIVDDDETNLAVVAGYLEMAGFENTRSTFRAVDALPLVNDFRPDLLLLDIHMPEMSGIEILKKIRATDGWATLPIVVLTASSTSATKLEALECGATDLLSKPVHRAELLARIRNVLTVKTYQDCLHRYSQELEEAVRNRTAELEASRLELIHCLARAAEYRDDDTGQHVIRVGRYSRIIGEQLGLSRAELDVLELAAQLHDIGKIGIPDAVLRKPGKLSREEYEVIQKHCGFGKNIVDCRPLGEDDLVRRHTELGVKIMEVASSPILQIAKQIALTHHERWDGKGYPLGLAGAAIPLEGRITAVADVFDALSCKRCYKPAFSLSTCFQIIEDGRGTQFDPAVIDAFLSRRSDVIQVQVEFAERAEMQEVIT